MALSSYRQVPMLTRFIFENRHSLVIRDIFYIIENN